MSGPLRRNQRSRPADAGEPLQEGLAAEPEGAAPTADTPPAIGDESATERLAEATAQPAPDEPAGHDVDPNPEVAATDESGGATTPATASEEAAPTTSAEAETPAEGVAPAKPSRRSRWRPFGKAKRTPPTEATSPAAPGPAPVLVADPDAPAGLDPAEAPVRPPTGRRGRLRRRLRYLRRARELMLRDLGGLLYEIHRTGGGRIEPHATVVRAKVQRIAGLDTEAHAIETALSAPRGETVVFEPGVGGTCATCGELYGSDAHYCSNCGAPTGAAAPVVPAPESKATETVAEESARRGFWRRAARAPDPAPDATSDETDVLTPTTDPAASGDETDVAAPDEKSTAGDATPTSDIPAEETPRTDAARNEAPKAAGDDPAAPSTEAASAQAPADESSDPSSRARNGRPEEHKPPGLSPSDPLISRESRS